MSSSTEAYPVFAVPAGFQADPDAPINSDIYKLSRRELKQTGIRTLPPTLLHALEAFEADPLIEQALGAGFKQIYLDHKLREWQQSFYQVSDEQRRRMLSYI
jgi:glutamine synthetase